MQSESIKTRQKHQATVLELHLSNNIIRVYPLCLEMLPKLNLCICVWKILIRKLALDSFVVTMVSFNTQKRLVIMHFIG